MTTPVFRPATGHDVERCYDIEISAYEGDEAATKEKIALRIAEYPQGFLILQVGEKVVGFINSGCAHEVKMSDEEFKQLVGHDPAARNVVIMSVVVAPEEQGKGYSSLLMREFVEQMRGMGKTAIYLMCKDRHVALYEKFGYHYLRPSESDHGGMAWHEMKLDL